MTGFCFWDRPTNWHCPETLQAFLHTEKPVVAVTAGSISPEERSLFLEYYQTSIESILACGARALVINAPENMRLREHREDVLHLPFAPFSEVFPACAAVIHHGGIGAIAQCLRAGVPSLVDHQRNSHDEEPACPAGYEVSIGKNHEDQKVGWIGE